MTDSVELDEGEQLVGPGEELLFRQIVGWMVQGDEILTHVFGPSTADAGKPSYARESATTASDSRAWHDEHAPHQSLGVWAVNSDEAYGAGRLVIDDSNAPLAANQNRAPGHCYVDFRGMAKLEIKSVRYLLWKHAMDRGEIPTQQPATQTADGELF